MDSELVSTTTVEAVTVAAVAGNGGESNFKHLNGKGESSTDVGNKSARPACYFCKGSHKSANCPSLLDSVAAPAANGSVHSGYISITYSHFGKGLFANIGTSLALTTVLSLTGLAINPGPSSGLNTVEPPSI